MYRTKRLLDLVLVVPALVVLAPVMLLLALVVRLRHGAPVLFHQERAGLGAAPIRISKFRTMTDDRGEDRELLADERRLTPLGRCLRASSLDELPQLWSVLKGEMSLVGPRPLPMACVSRYSPEQRRRLDALPGLTGWAQVKGRNALSWPEKLALDAWYVDHASLWLDVRIIAMTVRSLVTRTGITADEHATMPEFMGET